MANFSRTGRQNLMSSPTNVRILTPSNQQIWSLAWVFLRQILLRCVIGGLNNEHSLSDHSYIVFECTFRRAHKDCIQKSRKADCDKFKVIANKKLYETAMLKMSHR